MERRVDNNPPESPQTDTDTERAALEHAVAVLHACREGVLMVDGHPVPIKFITEHDSGRLVASVPAATFFQGDHTLFVPDETDDALQLLLSAEELQESATTDRWLGYHLGESEFPEHTRWAAFWIDSAKHGPWVFDGDPFMAPSPLATLEPKLCKHINAQQPALERLTTMTTGADETQGALCVGVEPPGLYVRLRHGVVLVPFDKSSDSVEAVESLIDHMLQNA